jgi:hypothetical protein
VFSCASSRNLKSFYTPVDGEDVLAKIRGLKIERWRYNDEVGQPWHIGPYSEEFMTAFSLGNDSLAIGHLDEMGITLKGVQALEARTQLLRQELTEKKRLIGQLEARVRHIEDLEARVRRLEELLARSTAE